MIYDDGTRAYRTSRSRRSTIWTGVTARPTATGCAKSWASTAAPATAAGLPAQEEGVVKIDDYIVSEMSIGEADAWPRPCPTG